MSEPKSAHITWHPANISHEKREALRGQKGCVVWFTGLSGSGKSTVARKVEELLIKQGKMAYMLDGDNLRTGLNKDLGFTPGDRSENIRRVSAVAQLFADATAICCTAFISPYRKDRQAARALLPDDRFIEVHVATSLEVCEDRDPKGLYEKARDGVIPNFTGISAPYEAPENPEITLDTANYSVEECAQQVIRELNKRGFLE